jgi:glycosyltransferase involved in cell wall biosynthesis
MFDVPRILDGRAKCFSYHDGCLAERLKSPWPTVHLSPRAIARTLEFERRVYSGMDRIFTFSHYLRKSIIANYGIDADRVSVLGSGINLDAVPAPPSNKRYDSQEILFIGVDFDRKGGRQLLQAFRVVRDSHPSAVLHIVGPRKLRIPAECSSNVHYHGFLSKRVPQQKQLLDRLFQNACLFVMPSLYEPFGIAPLEAMAHGIPAVVSNGWALGELVKPGVTGELAEVGNTADLADRIIGLLKFPSRLQQMGKQAREEVLGKYRWEFVVDRLLAAIDTAGEPSRKQLVDA